MRQAFGVEAWPLRHALRLLGDGWQEFDALVRETAAPRRDVEDLLAALGDDLQRDGTAVRLRPGAPARYEDLAAPGPEPAGLLDTVAAHIRDVPPALAALDHVQATPETVLRRARWLDEQYDLRTTRLLFLGDHDLTSLAVRLLRPEARLTVVDVDDRVLEYLDRHSGRTIRTVHTDLRFGLPLAVAGSADVVFSDPPYTPEGMALFASRGIECLADPPQGRLLLAYGYSRRHPALGQQAQRALGALGLTFEAILPGFHRYLGAQAIGSAADLYVCQPTARARKKGRSKGAGKGTGIYTHGPQSVEARETPPVLRTALTELAGEGGLRVETRGPDWNAPITAEDAAIALDLSADPGPWLVRALLATNAPRVAVLLPNSHPDLASARAQQELTGLLAPKYRLQLLRSTPDNHHAVVIAEAVPPDPATAARAVWSRAHGRLANVWPDAPPDVADLRLIDLPRHRLAEARDALATPS
ncbi:putative methyltransferase [Prauserella muralis]|uniref:Putative methyltransferase n=1 Tax=Prauserella muralis TaxID=588067 RepID=A0A2V4AMA6_9PSEU|nr:putative methyltransferase [Prauserella muralis]